jgi:hypothetical protein
MSDIQKFDMQSVQQRVSETMKAQFAMLIPDEAFEQMANTAITEFFSTETNFEFQEIKRPNPNGTYYTDQHLKYVLSHAITPFKAMLWEEVRKIVKGKIDAWLKSEVAAVNEKIETLYQESKVGHQVFELNVNDLALEMARNAHLNIISQAAMSASAQISSLAGQVQYLTQRDSQRG